MNVRVTIALPSVKAGIVFCDSDSQPRKQLVFLESGAALQDGDCLPEARQLLAHLEHFVARHSRGVIDAQLVP